MLFQPFALNLPFKRLWRKVNQRIGPDLEPVTLPGSNSRLATVLHDRLPAHASLESVRHALLVATFGAMDQCAAGSSVGKLRSSGFWAAGRRGIRGQTILEHRIVEQMARMLQRDIVASGTRSHLRVGLVKDAAEREVDWAISRDTRGQVIDI